MIDVIELAQRLIRTPSPVIDGDERAVAALTQEVLADTGLPAARVFAREETRPNLLSTIDFGPGGHHLVLCGHIDTKPVGEAAWTVDPFAADIDGDRLYGLGSGDMKAAVAAMIVAAQQLAAQPPARGRLSLLFTADEENGAEYGAKYLAPRLGLDADAVVIGEPGGIRDDYDGLHLVSRGLGRFELTAHALQGHSSLSGLLGLRIAGADLADGLSALRREARVRIPENPDGLRDWDATVNPGMTFRGGWGYGVLPEAMSATVEVRTLPGMTDEALREDLRGALAGLGDTDAKVTVDYDNAPDHWIPGSAVAATHPVVDAIRRASSAALGHVPPLSVFPGTTDASWFAAEGIPSLPALGPGLISRAHGADEWVSVAQVRRTVDLYRALASDFCEAADGTPDRPTARAGTAAGHDATAAQNPPARAITTGPGEQR